METVKSDCKEGNVSADEDDNPQDGMKSLKAMKMNAQLHKLLEDTEVRIIMKMMEVIKNINYPYRRKDPFKRTIMQRQ